MTALEQMVARLGSFAAALFLFLLPIAAKAAELRVYAAASLSDALPMVGKGFEEKHKVKLVYNFASSALLARQIERGAPADIFFSADEAKMDQLAKADLLKGGSRRTVLKNKLVVVVPTNSLVKAHSAKGLLQFKKIALAEPSSVPAGIYARQWLEHEELWSQLSPRIVPTENVRAALSAVAGNNVDASIVYATDAIVSTKVKVLYEVPTEAGLNISYPAAIIERSKNAGMAEDFLKYLAGAEASRIFERHKFIIPK